MGTSISLLPTRFAPSTSLTGGADINLFRAVNCRLEGTDGPPKIVATRPSKDLSINYDLSAETLTGSITTNEGDTAVSGAGTAFTTELHVGQMIFLEKGTSTDVLVVRRIESDTSFIADRPAVETIGGGTGYWLPTAYFDVGGKRGVLRRGNAVRIDRGDIVMVGDGNLFLEGTDTGFAATRKPKRLARQTDGTYIENPLGFDTTPTTPAVGGVAGGTKGMLGGNYSYQFSWYNSATKGFSNPSDPAKVDSLTALDIYVGPGGRAQVDFTTTLAVKTFLDAAVTIGTGEINFGAAHGRLTGDPVKLRNFGGALPVDTGTGSALASAKTFYVIKTGANTLKLARTKALADAGTAIVFTSAAGGGTHVLYSMPANADGFRVWQSASGGGVALVNDTNFANGPWYKASEILLTDLTSSHIGYVECVDAALGAISSGDNDAPPECEFVTEFANYLMWISALGNATGSSKNGTSPGNYVLCQKQSNVEAAPSDWAVSVGEEITGFAGGIGRLFCLTARAMPFISATGRTEISRLVPTGLDLPFTSRPFWSKGGISPHQVVTVQGDVFAWSGGKLLMSPRGSGEFTNPFEISTPVDDLTADWANGYVLLKHDPKNQQILAISSAVRKNVDGYWETDILPFDLATNTWQPLIRLTNSSRDMIVSAAEIIADRLEFLAGGRITGGSGYSAGTFRYDEADGTSVPFWFFVTPADLGEEFRRKRVHSVRLTGRFEDAEVKVYGTRDGGEFDLDAVEAGTGALATVTLDDAAAITRQFRKKWRVRRLDLAGFRFAGVWAGTGEPSRIDEMVVELDVTGD